MTLKVIKGLVTTPVRATSVEGAPGASSTGKSTSGAGARPHEIAVEGVISAAKSVSVAGEAVVTTIRATQKSPAFKEIRSAEEAEKTARKIAKEIDGGERESEALAAHSGLDSVGRSGKNGLLL